MLLITGTIRVPPENMETLRPAMAAVIAASRAEAGCIEYGFAEDVLDPGLIHVTERWESIEALAAHAKAEHMVPWRAAGAAAGVGERDLLLHEVSGSRAL